MLQKLKTNSGFSLFEMVVVIIVLSILVTIAYRSMQPGIEIAKTEETKQELDQIAFAIAGNPDLVSGSNRIDYGYVGDNGTLPNSLNDLVTNPGLATWRGPYIKDDFYSSSGAAESEYLTDGWGASYAYAGSVTITSNGGGSSITKEIAPSTQALLVNSFSCSISDLQFCPPGEDYKDSITINITYPNGAGGYTTDSKNPHANGFVQFDSLPIGLHDISVVDISTSDTLLSKINLYPKSSIHRDIQLPSAFWCDTSSSGGGGGGSPTSGIETLRPNGTGSYSQLSDENCTTNWHCVDEQTSDDNGTYVRGNNNQYRRDLYETDNSSVSSGTIDSVKIFINVDGNGGNQKARTYIRTHGNNYDGSQLTPPNGYNVYSTIYVNNPSTSSAWTWSEIDSIEIGARLRRECRMTQVWIEVYYTE